MAYIETSFKEGQVIFNQNDSGDSCYLVKSGSVDILYKNSKGENVILAELTVGAIFGEMALIEPIQRTASAIASSSTVLTVINKDNFQYMLEHEPNFAIKIIEIFRDRIVNSNDKFVNISISKGIHSKYSDSDELALKELNQNIFVSAPNNLIFEEGEIGTDGFILKEGKVKICKQLAGRKEIVLGMLKPGDIFGEMAIFGNYPRTASAISIERSVLIRFNSKNFLMLINKNPGFAMKIIKIMSTRLQSLNKRISEIS